MDGVMSLTEQILKHSWPEDQCDIGPLTVPFPRITYAESMQKYGSDKPDMRYCQQILNYTNLLTPYFQYRIDHNLRFIVYGEKGHCYSEEFQKEIDKIIREKQLENDDATVKMFHFNSADSFIGSLKGILPEKATLKIFSVFDGAQPGDLVVAGYGKEESVIKILGAIRAPVAKLCDISPSARFAPVWVTHFPLVQKGSLIGEFKPVHHPFTNITKESYKLFVGSPLSMESLSYDLVINGQEIAGGSERITDSFFQTKVLEKVGVDPKDLDHFLNALSHGCPPHAGIALGVDRLLACLLDAESIRDVIAFPKSCDGVDPLSRAPFTPSKEDKDRYRLK